MNANDDTLPIAVLFLFGMAIPLTLALLFHDVLSLYLTGRRFVNLGAVAFGLLAWILLVTVDPDRINFLLASIVFPGLVAVGVLFLVLWVGGDHAQILRGGFRYLLFDVEDLAAYAGSYVVAGVIALAVQRQTERLSRRYGPVPAPRFLAFGLAALAALGLVVGGAALAIEGSSAEISAVESGTHHLDPVLNVTVDGQPAELRLVVTDPDGVEHVRRLPRSNMENGPTTVSLPFHDLGGPPRAGTYRVELVAVSGVGVDSSTLTVETAPSPSIRAVTAAAPGEDIELELPPGSTELRPSPGLSDDETRVGVVVENEGDVADRFHVRLLVAEERVVSRDVLVPPDRPAGNVMAVPAADVERLHEETNGTLTVEVVYGDQQVTREITLPKG
ncbi:MAG: hypothetical protein V5A46_05250 [Haloferacaceae archaeon]